MQSWYPRVVNKKGFQSLDLDVLFNWWAHSLFTKETSSTLDQVHSTLRQFLKSEDQEIGFLQDVIHFAWKANKRIFTSHNSPILLFLLFLNGRQNLIDIIHLWLEQEFARERERERERERIKAHYANTALRMKGSLSSDCMYFPNQLLCCAIALLGLPRN